MQDVLRVKTRRNFIARTLAGSVSAVAMVHGPVRSADFTYKFSSNQPTEHPLTARAIELWERVRRDSGGRLEVQTFPNSQLGTDSGVVNQLRMGAIQFMIQSGPVLAGISSPMGGITNMPFAWKDTATVHNAFAGELGAIVRADIESHVRIKMFNGILDAGFRHITTSTKPITTADDLVGMKMRVPPAPIYVDLFKTLGCSTSTVEVAELYTALQTKLVDGEDNSLSIMAAHKFWEVQKYLSLTNHMWSGFFLIVNADAWAALPRLVQDAVERNVPQYIRDETRDNVQLDSTLAATMRSKGMIVNEANMANFRSKLKDFYIRWKEKFGAKAWAALERAAGPLG